HVAADRHLLTRKGESMTVQRLAAGLVALVVVCLGQAQPVGAAPKADPWSTLAARLVLADCPAETPSDHWARHYAEHPRNLHAAIERAEPWLPFVVDEIESRGLAGELALLPIVESGYDAFAYSHQRAAGSWQLLAATARHYGVEINDWYDGRRDMLVATPAALDYLQSLYRQFDDRWDLAIAAYNAGPGRVSRSLHARHGPGLVWQSLSLPGETRVYLSRIQGLSCLIADPGRYGFQWPPYRGDRDVIRVEIAGLTDIVALAVRSGIEPFELLYLNAGLKRLFTPPDGPGYLVVPASQAARVHASAALVAPAGKMVWSEINERRGDTLNGIAARHDASPEALQQVNDLDSTHPRIGQHLIIPSPQSRPEDSEYATVYQQLSSLQNQLLPEKRFRHQVRPGDNLWMLSQRYSVSAQAILRWNGLDEGTDIRPGQSLEIPPGAIAPRPHEYRVQPGDSLWTIAQIHRVSVADLVAWNDVLVDHLLQPGQILIVGDADCCLRQLPDL
ncbi:MAG: LysM peptidoglycan-binding domain-containing protein, partial [Wenzhouxiangella sp.]